MTTSPCTQTSHKFTNACLSAGAQMWSHKTSFLIKPQFHYSKLPFIKSYLTKANECHLQCKLKTVKKHLERTTLNLPQITLAHAYTIMHHPPFPAVPRFPKVSSILLSSAKLSFVLVSFFVPTCFAMANIWCSTFSPPQKFSFPSDTFWSLEGDFTRLYNCQLGPSSTL